MSMNVSFHSGPAQEKPTVKIMELTGHNWIDVQYAGGSCITFHGRSRAQCERLAAAWLAMWDDPDAAYEPLQPAELVPMAGGGNISRAPKINSPEEYREIAGRDFGLSDRIVPTDPDLPDMYPIEDKNGERK